MATQMLLSENLQYRSRDAVTAAWMGADGDTIKAS